MPDSRSPRLTLDTNTIMALWFFEDPALKALRDLVEYGTVALVSRADALEEMRRVLAYRQFAIVETQQQDILTTYTERCTVIAAATPAEPALPTCSDRDDQKFLEIARDGKASHLITRDKALLKLNRHRLVRPLYRILTPEAFCRELAANQDEAAPR
jgi:putative PIN family toxin of toxin-antitoxin system